MSLWKRIFGSKPRVGEEGAGHGLPATLDGGSLEYNGFVIRATPFKEAGQYQSCGVITKEIDGQMREHRFIRADRFSGMEDAVAMINLKARQIIDEQGERIFTSAD